MTTTMMEKVTNKQIRELKLGCLIELHTIDSDHPLASMMNSHHGEMFCMTLTQRVLLPMPMGFLRDYQRMTGGLMAPWLIYSLRGTPKGYAPPSEYVFHQPLIKALYVLQEAPSAQA